MKHFILGIAATLLLYSCHRRTDLQKECDCKEVFVENLEEIKDAKHLFSLQIPKDWKTNLYTDARQSSIYCADTIKELTKSLLLDVNYINTSVIFTDIFKLKIEQENLSKKHIQTKAKEITFLNKPSYYTVSIGKKGTFKYRILQIFTKLDAENSLMATAQIYGDSLVNRRICKAISLLEKIKIP
ncbi:hypothetical protein JL193_01300 [Polaribacter batillariae]|uniref:Gliding motility-associated lipoprotein GldD n=1 Tax=Polaribacter batillariae TaxID=2808900 RepID=A0ABX7SUQ8_9FLAO|nr:hypothetical protein [Polaribacter batillariae]QTD37970.1 hypothetical protein JL193_01300 [Polaribacter batillariae]